MSKITVSQKAQDYFKKLIAKQNMEGLAIRLSATNVGTPGVECGILYCPKEYITLNDEHFMMDGFEIVIDKSVGPYLDESEIDLGKDDNGDDLLTFHAPNLKRDLLGPDATLKDRVQMFIDNTVSPQLSGHGGAVTLVDVTEDGVVQVQFHGGCNGCSMVGLTLKEGIESQLKKAFGDLITEVVDVTSHEVSDETYA